MSETRDGDMNTMKSGTEWMSCERFAEIVHDLDRPGTEGATLRESGLAHAESCGRCARLLTEVESLDLALRDIAAKGASEQAPPAIEAALLRSFRNHKDASLHRKLTREIAAFGIAAAVLLAAGIAVHRFGPDFGKTPAGQNVQQASNSGPSTANQDEQSASPAQQEEMTTTASFIALPYADDPEGADGGTVIRVQLSGAALASLGMPVTFEGSGDSVPADLLVSNDGTPQAIRLVSQENATQEF